MHTRMVPKPPPEGMLRHRTKRMHRRHICDDPHAGRHRRRGRARRHSRERLRANDSPRQRPRHVPGRSQESISRNGDDPLISGIGSVSELIAIAGGEDALPKLRLRQVARVARFGSLSSTSLVFRHLPADSGLLDRRHPRSCQYRDDEQTADRRQQHAADDDAGQRLLHL